LQLFLSLPEYRDKPGLYAPTYVGSDDETAAQEVVTEL
jgi:hypothetical protein